MPTLLLALLFAQSQVTPVVIGESITIQSKVLNESRRVLISKPAGYDTGSDRYPVLYLLDGETHFHYTSGMVNFLAETDRIPKLLVVAIDSGTPAQRTRDLTPPSSNEIDNRFSPGSGGADVFLSFLASELIPYVDRTYRTRPYRLLAGHSFGGLFAVHALTTQPELFNGYIAIDPSLAWNNQATVKQAEPFFAGAKQLQADFYMTASNAGGKLPAGARRLAAILDEKAPAGFRWSFDWLQQETHASIPLRSIYQGLDMIFAGWRLTDPLELYDKGGLAAIHRHFEEGGRRFGYERKTSPFTISMIVAGLIWSGRLDEAATVLLHDPKNYPPPWNQLDALSRAYSGAGNVEQSTRFHELSLKEKPR